MASPGQASPIEGRRPAAEARIDRRAEVHLELGVLLQPRLVLEDVGDLRLLELQQGGQQRPVGRADVMGAAHVCAVFVDGASEHGNCPLQHARSPALHHRVRGQVERIHVSIALLLDGHVRGSQIDPGRHRERGVVVVPQRRGIEERRLAHQDLVGLSGLVGREHLVDAQQRAAGLQSGVPVGEPVRAQDAAAVDQRVQPVLGAAPQVASHLMDAGARLVANHVDEVSIIGNRVVRSAVEVVVLAQATDYSGYGLLRHVHGAEASRRWDEVEAQPSDLAQANAAVQVHLQVDWLDVAPVAHVRLFAADQQPPLPPRIGEEAGVRPALPRLHRDAGARAARSRSAACRHPRLPRRRCAVGRRAHHRSR